MAAEEIARLLEALTGETVPFPDQLAMADDVFSTCGALGYSQLNEVLLLSGLDRVSQGFFAYLVDGTTDFKQGMAFNSPRSLETGVARFRETALLIFGNVKFAFKSLSQDDELLAAHLKALAPVDVSVFEQRHAPVVRLKEIRPEDAYLTGYMIQNELERRLKNPDDQAAIELEKRRHQVVQDARENQRAYLASDHLDVYVATSMRARHEFISIARLANRIFNDEAVSSLRLRWFDPTQAYCTNRIDKGLAEALMLKRATCTIYLAQDSDTLGKDSELASTLAQGKPVIAYVPSVDEEYLDDYYTALREAEPDKSAISIYLDQLRIFDAAAAWTSEEVRGWCRAPDEAPEQDVRRRLDGRIREHYDRRATTLQQTHPLAIQVNLATGVANGVLVVRDARACAQLVRGIVTHTLEFDLETAEDCTVLRERISRSIFRVMTADAMLTNTFWNFYINPAQ